MVAVGYRKCYDYIKVTIDDNFLLVLFSILAKCHIDDFKIVTNDRLNRFHAFSRS